MTLVTERFQQCLKSLHLNEFPCHDRRHTSLDLRETETLLDLLRDKKSPWYEVINWSRDGANLRHTYVRDQARIDLAHIEKYFTSLRLNDLQIDEIDENVRAFRNLTELVLNCNRIRDCDSACLPDSLEILDLTGNYLTDLGKLLRKPMANLKHIGLGYNWIQSLAGCFNGTYWPAIRSLDLQYNQIDDLQALIEDLAGLGKLKVLNLIGNPVTVKFL